MTSKCKGVLARALWIAVLLGIACGAWAQKPFKTEWTIATNGQNVRINIHGVYTAKWYKQDQGPASAQILTVNNETGANPIHLVVAEAGVYILEAGPEGVTRFEMPLSPSASERKALTCILDFGDVAWTSFERAFHGCMSLKIAPDAGVPKPPKGKGNYLKAFREAQVMNSDLFWDMSQADNLGEMFHGASAFNGNITGWNVSKVTNMSFMFTRALAFNQNIGGWNVSSVTNMYAMFEDAQLFNGDWGMECVER